MIPAGTYKARAHEGALGKTGTGKEQVAIALTVIGGDHDGASLTWYGFFTEKTIDRTLESLRLLGWEGDDVSELRGIDRNEVSIVVEHEDDQQGNPRARVKWINGAGLQMKERLDDGAAKALAERLRAHVVAHRQKSGAKSAPASSAPMPTDDDLPF